MKNNPCQKALDKGRAERKAMSRNNPMCFSAYKIKQRVVFDFVLEVQRLVETVVYQVEQYE